MSVTPAAPSRDGEVGLLSGSDTFFWKKNKKKNHHKQSKAHMGGSMREHVDFLPQPIFFTHIFF